jgi:hypothetical protein
MNTANNNTDGYPASGMKTYLDGVFATGLKKCIRNVAWKESIQRYEMNELRNIAKTRQKLLAGESVRSGFVEFIRRERGKMRRIKSIHISERVVQKCLCDEALTPFSPDHSFLTMELRSNGKKRTLLFGI